MSVVLIENTPTCFWCGSRAARGLGRGPCVSCETKWKEGVVLVEAGEDPPYTPTGRWAVINREAVSQLIHPPSLARSVARRGVCKIPPDMFNDLISRGTMH